MNSNEEIPKQKILYVEDDLESANLVVILLKKNYEVITAESVQTASAKLKSEKFDLILMDIALRTKFEGIDFIRSLKSDETLKSIPIIALTAHALYGDKEKILEAGADDYISKPFTRNELNKKIENFIK